VANSVFKNDLIVQLKMGRKAIICRWPRPTQWLVMVMLLVSGQLHSG